MTAPAFPPGTFTPRPGRRFAAADARRAVRHRAAARPAQRRAGAAHRCSSRSCCWSGLSLLDVVPLPEPRIAAVAPGVLALAVMSTAFTGQAIALGFDRRYGVIRRLAATALPRWLLVAGRLVAVLGRRRPAGRGARRARRRPGLAARAPRAWAGRCCWCCSAAPRSPRSACCSAGRCAPRSPSRWRTLVWFVLLLAGGIVDPAGPAARAARRGGGRCCPPGALAEGLRAALATGRAAGGAPRCWCCSPGRRRRARWRSARSGSGRPLRQARTGRPGNASTSSSPSRTTARPLTRTCRKPLLGHAHVPDHVVRRAGGGQPREHVQARGGPAGREPVVDRAALGGRPVVRGRDRMHPRLQLQRGGDAVERLQALAGDVVAMAVQVDEARCDDEPAHVEDLPPVQFPLAHRGPVRASGTSSPRCARRARTCG